MIQLLESIQIKHADWPLLLTLFIPVLLLSSLVLIGAGSSAALFTLILLSLLAALIYQTHLYNKTRRNLRDQQQKHQAYSMLLSILKPAKPLPFMTDWAATPELALKIVELIQQHQPARIVELGGGISTVISSITLTTVPKTNTRSAQGSVLALDHDATYAERSRGLIRTHGLEDVATIRHTPLRPVTLKRGTWQWYDLSALEFSEPIDLLIVDGPPVKTQPYARYPALPLLYPHLGKRAVILVHDTHRSSESTFISWWMEEFPGMSMEKVDSEKGVTVIYTHKQEQTAPSSPPEPYHPNLS